MHALFCKSLNVPVGVIDCSWGGTPAEAWTALGGVRTIDGFEQAVDLLEAAKGDRTKMQQGYESQLAEWMKLTVAEDLDFDKSQYQEDWKTMPIPCEWEKSVLGEFDGIVWLQRRLTIPAVMAGKPLQLELGYIDDEDVTYFNGVKIAQGSGYNTPRRYTVPAELVKEGEAVITIRVSDFGGGGGLWGAVASVVASNAGGSISLAGDWGYRVAADFSKLPAKPASVEGGSFPTVLYNAMLHPLHTLPIKGVLWYQGCANVGRDVQYGPLFRRLIKDWRTLWKQEDLPFYFVQLAGYLRPQPIQPESQWAALRQAQADALTLPHTGMAVAIDVGNPDDIHPKNKQEVARRLALLALRHTYNKNNIVAEAPALVRSERQGENEVVLTFDTDLVAASNVPTGFIVETASGEWQQPEATLTSSRTIVLKASSPIRSVRYNWADYPDGNLRGRTLLPVAPFQCNLGGFY